jgi:Rps23 Pro-64 3,4-dihydroxylase Tpa1-like proline 4-hydroxylase
MIPVTIFLLCATNKFSAMNTNKYHTISESRTDHFMNTVFNPQWFSDEAIVSLKKQFDNARPYRHIVVDGLIQNDFAEVLLAHFPKKEDMRRHYEGINEKKSEGSYFEKYHPAFTTLRQALASEEFISFLEKVTGIKELMLPDDFRGAGVHQGGDGSFLDIHVDFSVHPVLNLHRRLNFLLFLNKGWKDEYGGKLELWNADVSRCEAEILPIFNRVVIFETSDISYHGYNKINVPPGVYRNSFFAYFHTPIHDKSKVKYHDTIFKPRPSDSSAKKLKTHTKETVKNLVKGALRTLGITTFFKKFE